MTVAATISPRLAKELADLNPEQRDAVRYLGNIVVRAGPGAGKTRTLVAKVGYLLDAVVSRHRGVAAITYTRAAAREVADRLDQLGIPPGRRLTSGTLHSWCLNYVVRPYGPLVGVFAPGAGSLVDDKSDTWINLLQHCMDEAGLNQKAQHEKTAINKLRRQIAAAEIADDDPSPTVAAARFFDQQLLDRGLCDYDSMVSQALRIVREHPNVADLLAARYPWLVIDEYQDLGPVLHCLVRQLQLTTGITVAAFGDPDQSILGFAGADPKYLNGLVNQDGYKDRPLYLNYRCGQAIVAASHAVLNERRGYHADPDRDDQGIIDPVAIQGGLEDHAATVITKIDELTRTGIPAHRIAILYRGRGPLLDELGTALSASSHGYVLEADQRIPTGELADFIRDCTARALAGPQPTSRLAAEDQNVARIIRQLRQDYQRLRRSASLPDLPGRTLDRRLASVLNHTFIAEPAISLPDWIVQLDDVLDLTAISERGTEERDKQAITRFLEVGTDQNLTPEDIAAGALRIGKVTLTTYHSAKGREWDFVILPGLVDGIMPCRPWFRDPTPAELAEDRRSFYVGLTRAKEAVVLIYGTYWISTDRYGRKHRNSYGGVSQFARDVLIHLGLHV